MQERWLKHSAVVFGLLVLMAACSTVPLVQRKQITMVPQSYMLSTSFRQYDMFLQKHEPVQNTAKARMVNRVGRRISRAVEDYLREHNLEKRINDFQWEFNIIQSETPNAWCMPGGKVVVYSGILPYTKDEAGLAVVIGHEIAHAIARHGNERMSQQLMVAAGGMALSVYLEEHKKESKNLFLAAYGLGSQVGMLLPYSRLHEKEADKLGMMFMAMAGYQPRQAVEFWRRMAAKKGKQIPEFLSTHPADETRIKNLKTFLPEAQKYYNP